MNLNNENNGDPEHNSLCYSCRKCGNVITCSTCTLVFHLQCCQPKLTEKPQDFWACHLCEEENPNILESFQNSTKSNQVKENDLGSYVIKRSLLNVNTNSEGHNSKKKSPKSDLEDESNSKKKTTRKRKKTEDRSHLLIRVRVDGEKCYIISNIDEDIITDNRSIDKLPKDLKRKSSKFGNNDRVKRPKSASSSRSSSDGEGKTLTLSKSKETFSSNKNSKRRPSPTNSEFSRRSSLIGSDSSKQIDHSPRNTNNKDSKTNSNENRTSSNQKKKNSSQGSIIIDDKEFRVSARLRSSPRIQKKNIRTISLDSNTSSKQRKDDDTKKVQQSNKLLSNIGVAPISSINPSDESKLMKQEDEDALIHNPKESISNLDCKEIRPPLKLQKGSLVTEFLKREFSEERVVSPSNAAIEPAIPPPWADVEDDGNRYTCEVCGVDGDLVCCDACPAVYHVGCLPDGPCADAFQNGGIGSSWYCPLCWDSTQTNGGIIQTADLAPVDAPEDLKSCQVCNGVNNLDEILLCDACDAEYHMYCLRPPLKQIPEDDWYCPDCEGRGITRASTRYERITRQNSLQDIRRTKYKRNQDKLSTREKIRLRQRRNMHLRQRSREREKDKDDETEEFAKRLIQKATSEYSESCKIDTGVLSKTGDWLMSALLLDSHLNAMDPIPNTSVDAAVLMATTAVQAAKDPIRNFEEILDTNYSLVSEEMDEAKYDTSVLRRLKALASDVKILATESVLNVEASDEAYNEEAVLYIPQILPNATGANKKNPKGRCLGCQNGWNHLCTTASTTARINTVSKFNESRIISELMQPSQENANLENGDTRTSIPQWAIALSPVVDFPNEAVAEVKRCVQNALRIVDDANIRLKLLEALTMYHGTSAEIQKRLVIEILQSSPAGSMVLKSPAHNVEKPTVRDIANSTRKVAAEAIWGCQECNVSDFTDQLIICHQCYKEFHIHCVLNPPKLDTNFKIWCCNGCIINSIENVSESCINIVIKNTLSNILDQIESSLTKDSYSKICNPLLPIGGFDEFHFEGGFYSQDQFRCAKEISLSNELQRKKVLDKYFRALWRQFFKLDVHSLLVVPVPVHILGYYNIVKNPMSLLKMRRKILLHEYTGLASFQHDFELMCNNAMKFKEDGIGANYSAYAEKMKYLGLKLFRIASIRIEESINQYDTLQAYRFGLNIFGDEEETELLDIHPNQQAMDEHELYMYVAISRAARAAKYALKSTYDAQMKDSIQRRKIREQRRIKLQSQRHLKHANSNYSLYIYNEYKRIRNIHDAEKHVNITGCSRFKPYQRCLSYKKESFQNSFNSSSNTISTFIMKKIEHFCQKKNSKNPNFYVNFHVQGLGIYSYTNIDKDEIVMEVIGEIIGKSIAMKRYQYNCQVLQRPSIMFQLDSESFIDITKKGNMAHFVSHSKQPNCIPYIITISGKRKLFLCTIRSISKEERITCDLSLPFDS